MKVVAPFLPVAGALAKPMRAGVGAANSWLQLQIAWLT
jgi:hypothetical protein